MREVTGVLGKAVDALRTPRVLLRLGLLVAVAAFLVRPLVPRVVDAATQLEDVNPWLTALGFVLQVTALFCYSVMTRSALGNERDKIGVGRLFRIQLVTRAVSSTVPGGAAAGPAVGYRFMAAAGISGRNASASLASAAVISAFILNVLLWIALFVSIPLYGFNAYYAGAALIGIVVMLLVAGIFVAIIDGSVLIERPVRLVAKVVRADAEKATASIRSFGKQIEQLITDRRLMIRLSSWAAANWLLDAMSLWVFLRAFGVSMSPVGLMVAFGIANVLAAIPISPNGIGIVEWAYIPILVGFGATFEQATIAVVTYRIAQFLFPIILGGLSYLSLTFEAWMDRRRTTSAVRL